MANNFNAVSLLVLLLSFTILSRTFGARFPGMVTKQLGQQNALLDAAHHNNDDHVNPTSTDGVFRQMADTYGGYPTPYPYPSGYPTPYPYPSGYPNYPTYPSGGYYPSYPQPTPIYPGIDYGNVPPRSFGSGFGSAGPFGGTGAGNGGSNGRTIGGPGAGAGFGTGSGVSTGGPYGPGSSSSGNGAGAGIAIDGPQGRP